MIDDVIIDHSAGILPEVSVVTWYGSASPGSQDDQEPTRQVGPPPDDGLTRNPSYQVRE